MASDSSMTVIQFKVRSEHCQDRSIVVSGDAVALGGFRLEQATRLEPARAEENCVWVSPSILVPRGMSIRYRYALFKDDQFERWENIDGDRVLFTGDSKVVIEDVLDVITDQTSVVPRYRFSHDQALSTAPLATVISDDDNVNKTAAVSSTELENASVEPTFQHSSYDEHASAYLDEAEGMYENTDDEDPHEAGQRALQRMTGYSQQNEVSDDYSSVDSGRQHYYRTTSESAQKHRTSAKVLQGLMVSRRYFVLSYHLPVILRCNTEGTWTALWDTDSFLSRSEHSVAKYIQCFWVGCITRRCIDRVTPEEGARRKRSGGPNMVSTEDIDALDDAKNYNEGMSSSFSPDLIPAVPNMSDDVYNLRQKSLSSGVSNDSAGDERKDSKFRSQGLGSSPPGPQALSEPVHNSIPNLRTAGQRDRNNTENVYDTQYNKSEYGHVEDWIELSDADKEGIRNALKPMNVVPIFMDELGVTEDVFRQFHQFLTMVLRPALHNVLDIGDEHSIFAMDSHSRQSLEQNHSASQECTVAPKTSVLSPSTMTQHCVMHAETDKTNLHTNLPSVRAARLQREGWEAYRAVNDGIAKAVAALHRRGDPVWTHNFQLCLVPKLLALRCKDIPQVFFMHAPFPTSEVFRTLPMREEILHGILESNVVGFHTFNHARHFLQCCKRVLGLNFQSRQGGRIGLDYHGRDVMVAISHVGVDVPKLKNWMDSDEAAHHAAHFRSAYPDKIIIAGFDSCERLSGIALKLLAFERLMEQNPRLRKHVVLVQRCEVRDSQPADYSRTSAELKNLVHRICKAFGPVVDYAEAISYPPTYRIGLFHTADVLLQTPIREGLNLMPLEYVYARTTWSLKRDKMQKKWKDGNSKGLSHSNSTQNTDHSIHERKKEDGSCKVGESSHASQPPSKAERGGWGKKAIDVLFRNLFPAFQSSSKKMKASKMATIKEEDYRASPSSGLGTDENEKRPRNSPSIGDGNQSSAVGPSLEDDNLRPMSTPTLPLPCLNEPLQAPLPPPERGGCIVLSEFSTACHILNSNLVVNPWNIEEVTKAIDKALVLKDEERKFRQWRDYMYATRNPSAKWAREVLVDLLQEFMSSGLGMFTEIEPSEIRTHSRRTTLGTSKATDGESGRRDQPRAEDEESANKSQNDSDQLREQHSQHGELLRLDSARVGKAFKSSKKRVIVLDYIRTLLNTEGIGTYVKHEFLSTALVKGSAITQELADILKCLASDPNTEVFAITGSSRSLTEQMFLARFPHVHLVAENGVAIYSRDKQDPERKVWHETTQTPVEESSTWQIIKERGTEIMKDYQWRVNGSEVHEFESVLSWDHRNSDPEWAEAQARFLANDLEDMLGELYLEMAKVTIRKSCVEVCLRSASKGNLMYKIAQMVPDAEFVLSIGDDSTDEEMFTVLHSIVSMKSEKRQITHGADLVKQTVSCLSESSFENVFAVKIGRGRTHARYFVPSVAHVHSLLVELSNCVASSNS